MQYIDLLENVKSYFRDKKLIVVKLPSFSSSP